MIDIAHIASKLKALRTTCGTRLLDKSGESEDKNPESESAQTAKPAKKGSLVMSFGIGAGVLS